MDPGVQELHEFRRAADLIRAFRRFEVSDDSSSINAKRVLSQKNNYFFAVSLIPAEEQSALETLCRTFEDVVLDAKHFRTHWWTPRIHAMIADGEIVADNELTNFFVNADTNL